MRFSRPKPELVQWSGVNIANAGNGTRIINKTSEQVCQAGVNATLIIFPGEVYSKAEIICQQHNGKLLTDKNRESAKFFLEENKEVLTNRCQGSIWIEKGNKTEFGINEDDCYIYNASLKEKQKSKCYEWWCFVCLLQVERSIFKMQPKWQILNKYYEEFTILNNENGNLIFFGSSGKSYFNSWGYFTKQNSNWTVVAEKNYSSSSLPGVVNLNYHENKENASSQNVQIKVSNVSSLEDYCLKTST